MRASAWLAGLVSAVAAMGMPILGFLSGLVILLSGLLCWVLVSADRTERLAWLIGAARRSVDRSQPHVRPAESEDPSQPAA